MPHAIVLASAALVALSACTTGQGTSEQLESPTAASVPVAERTTTPSAESFAEAPASSTASQATPVEPARPVNGSDMAGHIHNLAYSGRQLLIGTHEGLWGQNPGSAPGQLSVDAFDVMGLTRSDGLWLASGHPGEGMDAPSDLGLLQSTDSGRTWREVSLGGEVDFHRLVTSGDVVAGVNAHDGRLLRSDDSGSTWTDLGVPGLYDLAISPTDPAVIVGTTEDGPVRSMDSGATFQPIADAPLIALLAWTGITLYGIDVDGQVLQSTDDGTSWSPRGSLTGQPVALAAEGTSVAALVDDVILESVDSGESFAPRITDLGGH
jgi:hypothetical protein